MPRLKFVNELTEEAKQQLEAIYHDHTDFAFCRRAHAILLSSRGFTISQMQDIFAVDRETVSAWLGMFEQSGADGLKPLQRPGRPAIYTEDEVRQLKELVDQEPRQIKHAQAALQQATGKSSCTGTIKRALKKARLLVTPLPPCAVKTGAATPPPSKGKAETSTPSKRWPIPD